ncbi:MAG: hypothetical protein JSV43_04955 [Methanobacteriota archaeon]|nr:MAG: hypothetical protein JSV43_04955 [Euryarchaeota archaeon]
MGEDEEVPKLSASEVRKTIATSLATAFGFVIALLWKEAVLGGLNTAGVTTDVAGGWTGWAIFIGSAVVLTVVLIIFIILVSRWGAGSKPSAS